MKSVGIRELKNRLTYYVRLTKQGSEILITERGKPVALMQRIEDVRQTKSRDATLAQLGAQGRLILPSGPALRLRPVRIKGPSLAQVVVQDRDERT